VNPYPYAPALRLWRALPQCVLFFAVGCSAAQEIATSTNSVYRHAQTIREEAAALESEGETKHAPKIMEAAAKIQNECTDIQNSIPKIKDIVPAWLATLQLGLLVLGGLVVCYLLFSTGLGSALKVLFGYLPSKKKIQEVDLLKSVLSTDSPESIREYVASRRASDAAFNAAWETEKKTASTPADTKPPATV